ncbi:MAG: hypothetical protein ACRDJN_14485 [Chloroflexota bacterium]
MVRKDFVRAWTDVWKPTPSRRRVLQLFGGTAIAVDADNNVTVANSGNDRSQHFTATGAFVRAIGRTGAGSGEFDFPAGVAVRSGSVLTVADLRNNRFQQFVLSRRGGGL